MILQSPPFRRPPPDLLEDVLGRLDVIRPPQAPYRADGSIDFDFDDRPRSQLSREADQLHSELTEAAAQQPTAYRRLYDKAFHAPFPDDVEEGARARLAVTAEITARGNLSVLVRMFFFGKDGRWHEAPEWNGRRKFHTETYRGGWGERPADELLFYRNAGQMFTPRDVPGYTVGKQHEPIHPDLKQIASCPKATCRRPSPLSRSSSRCTARKSPPPPKPTNTGRGHADRGPAAAASKD